MKLTFAGALQIALIVLKLCGVIDWSWWVVLIPGIAQSFFTVPISVLSFIEEWNKQMWFKRIRTKK